MKMIQFFLIVCISTQTFYSMRQASRKTISKAVEQPATNALIKKLQKIFTIYQQENPNLTPAQQALYHFQNTKVPSAAYVPIIPVSNYNQNIALYDLSYCSILLYEKWKDLAPSMQYATLLHEYRHRLQHIFGIFDQNYQNELAHESFYPLEVVTQAYLKKVSLNFNLYTKKSWKPYEYDADYFAATHISCPTCLKICQCAIKADHSNQGYFNKQDLQIFIDIAQNNAACPAHSLISQDFEHNKIVKKLHQALQNYAMFPNEQLYDQIVKLDEQSGTLLQHISDFAQDLINELKKHEDFAQLLINKTIKEMDIAKQIQQTERDLTAGKFKLLTAGNEPIVSEKIYDPKI